MSTDYLILAAAIASSHSCGTCIATCGLAERVARLEGLRDAVTGRTSPPV